MTKKVLYTNFNGIEEIIDSMVNSEVSKKKFSKKNLTDSEKREQGKQEATSLIKRAITRSNLFKFWKTVVGDKFKDVSRPFSMTANYTMVVACKTSIVAQELMLRKTKLIKDFEPYAKALKITVKDMRFDVKKWVEEKEEQNEEQ